MPASGVLSFIEAYTSDHANLTQVTQQVDQDKIGTIRFYNNPLRFNGQLCPIRRGTPLLGEDTDTILRELGYTPEQIAQLYEDEVVGRHLI